MFQQACLNNTRMDTNWEYVLIESFLDFESRKIHRLVLRATDEGSPPLSSMQNIQITVEDRNDNAPIFDQKVSLFGFVSLLIR